MAPLDTSEVAAAWRVERLAEQADVSVDTIRYYQKLGLLHPPERRGRVAIYDATHLERLLTVRRLSDEGFSLSQIERLLEGTVDPLFDALQSTDRSVTLDQLVELSGFPAPIVELAVDAGLIRPLPTDPGTFDPDAVSLLNAASALLEAGQREGDDPLASADEVGDGGLPHRRAIREAVDQDDGPRWVLGRDRALGDGVREERGRLGGHQFQYAISQPRLRAAWAKRRSGCTATAVPIASIAGRSL